MKSSNFMNEKINWILYCVKNICKEEMLKILEINKKSEEAKTSKEQLANIIYEKISKNLIEREKLISQFPDEFAMTPTEVQEITGITKTERLRWTK